MVLDAFPARLFVTVVAKFASFPNAVASSFNVSKAAGALATRAETFVSAYALAFVSAVFAFVVASAAAVLIALALAASAYAFVAASWLFTGSVTLVIVLLLLSRPF